MSKIYPRRIKMKKILSLIIVVTVLLSSVFISKVFADNGVQQKIGDLKMGRILLIGGEL